MDKYKISLNNIQATAAHFVEINILSILEHMTGGLTRVGKEHLYPPKITEASISVMQLQDVWHNLCKHMETRVKTHGQVREVVNALKFDDRCKLHG